jgi:hypothetical protein
MVRSAMRAPYRLPLTLIVLSLMGAGCAATDDDPSPSSLPHSSSLHPSAPEGVTRPFPTVGDAGVPDATQGMLFGQPVSSYVTMSQDTVTSVGVTIPLAAIEAAPEGGPFRNELVLDMPAAAKAQTFLSQLRVNWLAYGHGPQPYGAAHFDFHFYRGTTSAIDAIACDELGDFPPEILSPAQQPPDTCVPAMGYHAWPKADGRPGATFTASLILGYTLTELVFIEPMITRATLRERRDFERAITPPAKSGSAVRTLFPTRMRVRYQPDGLTLHLEFDRFVALD